MGDTDEYDAQTWDGQGEAYPQDYPWWLDQEADEQEAQDE